MRVKEYEKGKSERGWNVTEGREDLIKEATHPTALLRYAFYVYFSTLHSNSLHLILFSLTLLFAFITQLTFDQSIPPPYTHYLLLIPR
jgi:hypothetical protein